MTPNQFRAALDRLGLTQGAAAKLLGVTPRTARNWASHGVSGPAATLLRLLLDGSVKKEKIEKITIDR